MRREYDPRRGFTLIEALVVFGIIGIVSATVIVVLNPNELLRQSRDGVRLSDFATIDSAIRHYQFNSRGSLGSSTVIYVSLPDPAATSSAGTDCASLGLPALTSGWVYHCASSANLRKLDGTGWLPIRFSDDTTSASMGALPVDPVNSASFRVYYIYTTNGVNWELNARLQSVKYGLGGSKDSVSLDGGDDPTLLEGGSLKSLMPSGAAGLGQGNIDATDAYAWSENIGWIDFYNSGSVGVTASKLTGYASSSLGTIALDCATSPNGNVCSTSDFSVANDGSGNLSGWAWGDEAGWISFSCTTCGGANYGVTISATGTFTGWAYSENFGWISFNCAGETPPCSGGAYKVRTTWTH
jgi:type II secretory pathway pseudopilin PulG